MIHPQEIMSSLCFTHCYIAGVSITPIDETNFKVFAPNQSAMDEASEKIDELLKDEVCNFLEINI